MRTTTFRFTLQTEIDKIQSVHTVCFNVRDCLRINHIKFYDVEIIIDNLFVIDGLFRLSNIECLDDVIKNLIPEQCWNEFQRDFDNMIDDLKGMFQGI